MTCHALRRSLASPSIKIMRRGTDHACAEALNYLRKESFLNDRLLFCAHAQNTSCFCSLYAGLLHVLGTIQILMVNEMPTSMF